MQPVSISSHDGAVGDVGVEPVADAGADDDHGAPPGFLGVRGELPGHPEAGLGWHRRDRCLPGRGVGHRLVVVAARPFAGQAGTLDAVVGEHQVEDRGDLVLTDLDHRDAAPQDGALPLRVGETGGGDLDRLGGGVPDQAERRVQVAQVEVPFARPEPAPSRSQVRK